jgi:hypothetical protein
VITQFRLQDFKGHRDTELPLGRFTMLVGDLGAGKTSVLEALWLQSAIGTDPVAAFEGEWYPADLLRRGAAGPIRLSSVGESGSGSWSSAIQIAVTGTDWKVMASTSEPSGGTSEHGQERRGIERAS